MRDLEEKNCVVITIVILTQLNWLDWSYECVYVLVTCSFSEIQPALSLRANDGCGISFFGSVFNRVSVSVLIAFRVLFTFLHSRFGFNPIFIIVALSFAVSSFLASQFWLFCFDFFVTFDFGSSADFELDAVIRSDWSEFHSNFPQTSILKWISSI